MLALRPGSSEPCCLRRQSMHNGCLLLTVSHESVSPWPVRQARTELLARRNTGNDQRHISRTRYVTEGSTPIGLRASFPRAMECVTDGLMLGHALGEGGEGKNMHAVTRRSGGKRNLPLALVNRSALEISGASRE